MIYSKKYPLPLKENEFILAEWERGYKNIILFYEDQEIKRIDNINQIKNGFSFFHEKLGNIELKFSEKPMSLDLIVNNLHSSTNNSHPVKKIKSIKNYFIMFGTLALLYSILLCFIFDTKFYLIFAAITEIPFIFMYFLCAYKAGQSKAWAVYVGFIIYSFFTLASLLSIILPIINSSIILNVFIFLIKIVFIFLLIPYVKMANELKNYKSKTSKFNSVLIDEF